MKAMFRHSGPMPTRPPTHKPRGAITAQQSAAQYDAWRGSAASRGYDDQWRKFREWFLLRHELCADCENRNIVMAANEVHHVLKLRDRPDLRCVEANCIALCTACHSARTARGE
jgi:5-methylcytosine-specific restriction enzyme A